MAILVDEHTRVLVQGVTGRVGSFQTKIMLDSGTRVVCGVTPGKGGSQVHGVPVYDLVEEALDEHIADAAICFVPGRLAVDAAFEAIDGGVKLLVITAEGVPDHDMLSVLDYATQREVVVVGPDTPGLVSPDRCKVGVHPAQVLRHGSVGIVSKSGALSYEVCRVLLLNSYGQSTVVGIGGGPIWGLAQDEVLAMFEQDDQTEVVILLGEAGGTMEQRAAARVRKMNTPVVALVVGQTAPVGTRMGHAGAIVESGDETAQAKAEVLRSAGAHVVERPSQIPALLAELGVR